MWLNLIDAVSELTKYNFGQVFELPALEFFTYVSYVKYKNKKEEEQIRKFRAQHRNG